MITLRDKRQVEFADVWLQSKRGILYLCPRFGKIKTTINILEAMKKPKTLIIYPIEPIKKSWEEDFIKWGYKPDNITYCTTASLWKLVATASTDLWDLIVIDEIHLLSQANLEELNSIIDQSVDDLALLGLSGTISEDTEHSLMHYLNLNIVAHYDIATAIKEKVITDYKIVVVLTGLDRLTRYIQPSKAKPEFKITEYQRYVWLSDKMEEIKQRYLLKRRIWEAKWISADEREQKELMKTVPDLSKDYGLLPIQRMGVFKKSVGKKVATIRLIQRAERNKQRALIFCGTIEVANSLGVPVFHSKDKDLEVRDAFCRGEGQFLATVDMFEAGVTVKPINVAIINSFDSNPENLAQRISRLTGFEYDNPEKVAKVYIVCTDTVERKWLTKALEFFDLTKVTYVNG